MPSGTLARRALEALALGLLPLALQLECEAFALVYSLHLGFGLVLVGTVTYLRDLRRSGPPPGWSDVLVAGGALSLLWLVVFLAVTAAWAALPGRPVFASLAVTARHVDARVVAAALASLAWAVRRMRRVAAGPETPDGGLAQPVLVRALCVAAFVFFGPPAFELFRALGATEALAVGLAYALSEAYPFLATLIDRGLDRVWPA